MRRTILTIAGSDSSGGAGIQADLKAIAANGGYGASVLTAVTAQNTLGVLRFEVVSAALLEAQLDAVLRDLDLAAVKTGMLGSEAVVGAVAARLAGLRTVPYVCDPVLVAKHGDALLEDAAVAALRDRLFPLATVVTPNVHEAEVLSGRPIRTIEDAEAAGLAILRHGARAVLVKGGHLAGSAGTDVLVTPSGVRRYAGEWIDSDHTHGTGCTYSAAIATWLGRGTGLEDSVAHAKHFVTEAIRAGSAVGAGIGPTEPFFFLRSPAAASAWAHRLQGAHGARHGHSGMLHVVTDEVVQTRLTHAEIAREAAAGGADVVQFREKRPRTTAELVRTAAAIAKVLEGTATRLVINDRADVAAAVNAAGVHLGAHDLPVATARAFLGESAWIGATANSREEAARVAATGIDYLGAGPVFGTATKANPAQALGLEQLATIARETEAPVVAIGSITADRVAEVLAAGVAGIAVVSAVVGAPDPAAATRALREAIDRSAARATEPEGRPAAARGERRAR